MGPKSFEEVYLFEGVLGVEPLFATKYHISVVTSYLVFSSVHPQQNNSNFR